MASRVRSGSNCAREGADRSVVSLLRLVRGSADPESIWVAGGPGRGLIHLSLASAVNPRVGDLVEAEDLHGG